MDIYEKIRYKMRMRELGIELYNPIGKIRKGFGWVLVGCSLIFPDLGLCAYIGCFLLGIPMERVFGRGKDLFYKVYSMVRKMVIYRRVFK